MKNSKVKLPVFEITLLLLMSPVSAFAYLDPGTGSIILQGIIGAIALGMATGRLWWYRLKAFFSPAKDTPEKNVEGSPELVSKD